jgi:Holliday junction DNA helicase RuvA
VIASLTGRVVRLDLDALVLEVAGIGYLVRTTPQALASTRHGAELTLHTELVVREDSLTLYGFPHPEEAETFRIVQSVSGIGPRTALAVLAVLEPEELRRAVAEQDIKTITRTPGIGPKVAGRMLLELGGKLPAPSAPVGSAPAGAGAAPALGGPEADVVEALVGLGWAEKAARGAVETARAEGGQELDAAARLRTALRGLGGHR